MAVYVNGRSVVHRQSDGKVVTISINLTGEEQVPVPYVNTAYSRDAENTCRGFLCNGEPICSQQSYFSRSQGDEPGEYGGILSRTVNAKAEFVSGSANCHIAQNSMSLNTVPIARAGDLMVSNQRNTPPAPLEQSMSQAQYTVAAHMTLLPASPSHGSNHSSPRDSGESLALSFSWSELRTLPSFFRKIVFAGNLRQAMYSSPSITTHNPVVSDLLRGIRHRMSSSIEENADRGDPINNLAADMLFVVRESQYLMDKACNASILKNVKEFFRLESNSSEAIGGSDFRRLLSIARVGVCSQMKFILDQLIDSFCSNEPDMQRIESCDLRSMLCVFLSYIIGTGYYFLFLISSHLALFLWMAIFKLVKERLALFY